jgi:aminoglycoside phosphotransferase family enzyme/predicted kinase
MPQEKINQLIASLQNPVLYKHPVSSFEVIETHISWVLLTGDYAYKFKKPVDLGFLDFSTLEKRYHYCQEELRLNSRLAPDIYLDVIKITGSEQAPAINGKGPVIEYAVKMRQFPQQELLINRAREKKLTPAHMDQLALCIAGFHTGTTKAAKDTDFGTADAVLLPMVENFKQIFQFTGNDYKQELDQLKIWSEQEQKRLYGSFQRRKIDGFIRECHGDLHLANIVIYNGIITPFDGVEFNENLYWIDVISEVAFLMMDLEDHRYRNLAFRFLNAWLEQTGDYRGLVVLRYYLVYRAMVRAKINSIRLKQQGSDKQMEQCRNEFENYLQLAIAYTHKSAVRLIICFGLSGSGKTTASQLLLETIPGIRIRSDVERKRIQGIPSEMASSSGINTGLYSPDMSQQTYQRLYELARLIIESGYTVIVDATFLKQQQRKLFQALALEKKVSFHIVHCHAKYETMCQRIKSRQQSGGDASEADLDVLDQQIDHQQLLSQEENGFCIDLDTNSGINSEQLSCLLRNKKLNTWN